MFCFSNSFGKSFQRLFANSQRYIKKDCEKHFQDLKFSPPNAFPLTCTKLPLDEILLLVFKRVLPIERRSNILDTNLKYVYLNFHRKMPIENFFKNFEIGGGGVLLLWAIFLPLWH
jgi:hypothetical protein